MSPIGNNFDDLFASVFSTPLNEPSDIEAMPHQQTNPHALPSLDNLNDLAVSEQDQYQSQDMGAVDVSGFDSGFDSPPSEPRRCCLTMALEILTQLFPNAPTACSLSGNQIGSCKVPTIESVISENKQIIEAINNMLDCHCSQDEYLLAIISLIVFKVMAWYAAAAGDKSLADNGMSWTNSFVALSDRQRTNSFGEQVLHLPTTIGNYCVDGNDRSRMAAQLVLSELHRVQRLVNLLSKRLETIRLRNACLSRTSSGSSSVADSGDVQIMEKRASPLSAPTFHQLEADLRKRLRTVSSDTIDILRLE
jgi:Aflatoxin regulatory protein